MARPNIVVLRELLKTLPALQKLFAMLDETDELAEWVTVDELIERLEIGRRNAVDLLRGLADAGTGEFKLGRKGHPSRLVWSTDPRALVDKVLGRESVAAFGTEAETEAATEAETEALAERERPAASERRPSSGSAIDHAFMLRPDLRIQLSLPVDLNNREAAALGDWVRNLSFDR